MREIINITNEECLEHYLELESLFSELFEKVNFCVPNCISKEQSLYFDEKIEKVRGDVGCCNENHCQSKKYLVHNDLLEEKRLEKYGSPKNKEKPYKKNKVPCRHHTENGCELKDLKSPVCIAYACIPLTDHLWDKYKIPYGYKTFRENIVNVLNSKMSINRIEHFKTYMRKEIKKVDEINLIE
jgi:hypothetical protein